MTQPTPCVTATATAHLHQSQTPTAILSLGRIIACEHPGEGSPPQDNQKKSKRASFKPSRCRLPRSSCAGGSCTNVKMVRQDRSQGKGMTPFENVVMSTMRRWESVAPSEVFCASMSLVTASILVSEVYRMFLPPSRSRPLVRM